MQTAATVASDSIKTKRKVADGEDEQMFAAAQETTSTWRQSSIQYSVLRKRAMQLRALKRKRALSAFN